MTKQALKRGIELNQSINALRKEKENLEEMQALCFENMGIDQKCTHTFIVKAEKNNSSSSGFVFVSAGAAYSAVCKDIEYIEKEIAKLEKELSDL